MSISLWNPNFCNVTCCRLCIIFLGFDVFFVVFCVALACIIGIAVCCCLPCIIAILYAVADQVAFFYSHHVIPVVFILLTYNINNFVSLYFYVCEYACSLDCRLKYFHRIVGSKILSGHYNLQWLSLLLFPYACSLDCRLLSKYYNLQCLSLSHSLTHTPSPYIVCVYAWNYGSNVQHTDQNADLMINWAHAH